MSGTPTLNDMLVRERIANRRKHWVRAVTACNSHCLFCLDSETPRNLILKFEEICAELDRGRVAFDADKVIISGGEASLHPQFFDLIRYAKSIGYERVQTVTNGYRFADRDFFDGALDAGLGEITFSLHGHTPELHDHLTQTEGAFHRLMKGMVRAIRDGRPIVNVDVVINKQNVAFIDKIVELCISAGVTEFDLLHVIPQAAAYDNRDDLFYDPTDYLPTLHKVFRLNRHPRFVIWTNRFPIAFLEGLEDLIQDPHKMLDEVNGRRFQVRRFLDEGTPLDCRQPQRCVHCFMEPFCTTMDRVVDAQNAAEWDVWAVDTVDEALSSMPFGTRMIGLSLSSQEELESIELTDDRGIYARIAEPGPLHPIGRKTILVCDTSEHLNAWLAGPAPSDYEFEIHLNRETAPWLLARPERVSTLLDRVWIHQPSYEHLSESSAQDVRDPAAFFARLALPVRASGFTACLAPGTVLDPGLRILRQSMFDGETGRLSIADVAKHHVGEQYRVKSLRCHDCKVNDRCEGIHVNMVRDQGLRLARPLTDDEWGREAQAQMALLQPNVSARLSTGKRPSQVAESLPGFPPPSAAPPDPLEIVARNRQLELEARARLSETRRG